jgi:hypothetical protein
MAGDGFGPQAARTRGKRQRECACPGFEPVAARTRSKRQRAQEVAPQEEALQEVATQEEALQEVEPQAGELLHGEEVQEVELLEGAGSTCSLALAEEAKPTGSALISVC